MKRILTVDDSSSIRQMVNFTLTKAGYEVAEAVDGKVFDERQIFKKPCLITKETVPPKGQAPDFATCPLYSADIGKTN